MLNRLDECLMSFYVTEIKSKASKAVKGPGVVIEEVKGQGVVIAV